MIARRIRGRLKRKMNKKLLTALLIPIMLLPLISFGYAHWTDTVEKRYKLRPGTVEIHIIQWHIDWCTSYDCNCNGEVLGDELQIVPQCDDKGEVIGLWIQADPIFPCWELELKMLVHVKGRLAVRFPAPKITFDGPFEDDPCFDPIVGGIEYDWDDKEFPGIDWFTYVCTMWKHNDAVYGDECDPTTHPNGCPCYDKSHYDQSAGPTAFRYKPCECIMIKQYMHLKQESPTMTPEELQKLISCKWLRIDFELEAINEVGIGWDSEGATYPGDWTGPYEAPEVPSNCP
jgi:hypothetical protein